MKPQTLSRLLAVATLTLAVSAEAGMKKAPKSPPAETTATLAGKQVKIAYAAPSMNGRKIFGALVPYGQVWCTGANAATTLTTEVDLDLKGLKIPKGTYTLFTVPTEGGMALIVNKQTGQWGTKHDAAQDLGKVDLDVKKPDAPVEKLLITLASTGDDAGTLTIAWENVSASAPISAAK